MPDNETPIKHVLGLSGGKDSSALAIYMRDKYPDLEIEYFFTDTGEELEEVYEYLNMLEGYLGKPINYLDPNRDFKFYMKQYNNFLPSAQARWCTVNLKLAPFEKWVDKEFLSNGMKVKSYVAIRSDENFREGLKSNKDIETVLPFKEDHIDKQAVFEILENSGLGLPKYYDWRSRSGCTFCFFQRKIEWVGLMERHPEAFENAKRMEKTALDNGSPFTWCQGESLEELSLPERVAQIKADHKKKIEAAAKKRKVNPLRPDDGSVDFDELYGNQKVCLACHK
jgi:3'-phosphoadenosine 5'-phosphosulfate sulfotransferase (PAPS reductase)/FAD synthetase